MRGTTQTFNETTGVPVEATRVIAQSKPKVMPPARFPGRKPEVSGMDFALSQLADQVHPVTR